MEDATIGCEQPWANLFRGRADEQGTSPVGKTVHGVQHSGFLPAQCSPRPVLWNRVARSPELSILLLRHRQLRTQALVGTHYCGVSDGLDLQRPLAGNHLVTSTALPCIQVV